MKGFDSQWYLRRTGIQLAAPKKRKKRGPSPLEAKFERLWKQYGYDRYCPFEKEVKFHEKRRYRFDFAWKAARVALELDGAIWMKKGGHTTGSGKSRDMDKDWVAAQNGWRVIRWGSRMLTPENCEILCSVIYSLTPDNKRIRFVSVAG